MKSTRQTAAIVLGIVLVLYTQIIVQALLVGVVLGSFVVVAERLHAKQAIEGRIGAFGALFAVVNVVLLVGYALLITQQFLIGPLAVAAFLAAVWLSGSAESESDETIPESGGATGN